MMGELKQAIGISGKVIVDDDSRQGRPVRWSSPQRTGERRQYGGDRP